VTFKKLKLNIYLQKLDEIPVPKQCGSCVLSLKLHSKRVAKFVALNMPHRATDMGILAKSSCILEGPRFDTSSRGQEVQSKLL